MEAHMLSTSKPNRIEESWVLASGSRPVISICCRGSPTQGESPVHHPLGECQNEGASDEDTAYIELEASFEVEGKELWEVERLSAPKRTLCEIIPKSCNVIDNSYRSVGGG